MLNHKHSALSLALAAAMMPMLASAQSADPATADTTAPQNSGDVTNLDTVEVTGIRQPHKSDARTRQCAKLGKDTKACRPIRSRCSSTTSGARVVCRVWLRMA